MNRKTIYIILVTITLAFAGCTSGSSSSGISGMEMGDGLK